MMIDKSFEEIQGDITALAFEEAFGLLGEVVSSLEEGGLTLEDSVDLYKKGMMLTKHCNELLNKVQIDITNIKEQFQES